MEDNQSAIALGENPVNRQWSEYIDIRYHIIRSEVNKGSIVLEYCPTTKMVADLMTKPATAVKLKEFSSLMLGI